MASINDNTNVIVDNTNNIADIGNIADINNITDISNVSFIILINMIIKNKDFNGISTIKILILTGMIRYYSVYLQFICLIIPFSLYYILYIIFCITYSLQLIY